MSSNKQSNMKKEFVPYEQALELEQLGFNEPCFAVYSEFDKTRVYEEQFIVEGLKVPAPTFSQSFRWFREKYLLDSWIYCSDENKGYFAIIVCCKRLVFYNENKSTYEEAELACLIKLIDIVKSKQNG